MYAQPNIPNSNNISRLTSVTTNDLSNKCVVFYYNMFSSDSNKLNVYLTEKDISSKVWSANTDQGNLVINH